MTTILGIETSCDETAAAVVRRASRDAPGEILSNTVYSQISDHEAYGGVVPEIAARAHVEGLDAIIARAMAEADMTFDDIDAVIPAEERSAFMARYQAAAGFARDALNEAPQTIPAGAKVAEDAPVG